MKNFLITIFLLLGLFSCSTKVVDIKSPCVSSEDGPCGPKKPINDWWIKDHKKHHLNSLS
jgi:hypothetical protein